MQLTRAEWRTLKAAGFRYVEHSYRYFSCRDCRLPLDGAAAIISPKLSNYHVSCFFSGPQYKRRLKSATAAVAARPFKA
jgi:hypothetical protein